MMKEQQLERIEPEDPCAARLALQLMETFCICLRHSQATAVEYGPRYGADSWEGFSRFRMSVSSGPNIAS